MKFHTPISLFSFQDIITCLTGIMIVIVLVLLLSLVDAVATATSGVDCAPEYQAQKQYEVQLMAQRDELKAALASLTDEYADLSAAELRRMADREEARLAELTAEEIRKEKKCEELVAAQRTVQEQLVVSNDRVRESATLQQQLQELQVQLAGLTNLRSRLDDTLGERRRVLRLEFSGLNNRTPLLVECNSWGFRTRVYPSGPIQILGLPKQSNAKEYITSLREWLHQEISSPEDYYVVLLFREDGLEFYREIRMMLDIEFLRVKVGAEPITSEEDCLR